MKDEYDYIILGAGSAGCVLANELSQNPDNRVLILEAGPMDHKLMIHMPAGVHHAYKDPSINWNYQSEAEPGLDQRNITLPRGKVIGGSSSINSMVYMRGHPQDYDLWASRHKLSEWSFAKCLPYFKHCECSDRGADDWRGDKGRLGVTRGKLDNPLYDAFFEAGRQSGQGYSEDLNGFQPEGLARLDSTTKHGRRCSAAIAHLKPALPRPNLSLKVNALVHRVVIENNRAVSVIFEHQDRVHNIKAAREVIVCAGAIKSPQILMLSGIGPSEHLNDFGIDVVRHLPGVGQNLQDHLTVDVVHECTRAVTFDRYQNSLRQLAIGLQWIFTRKGFVASNVWEAGGFIYGNHKVDFPNLQYHFAPVNYEYQGEKIKLSQGFITQLDQLRPRSKGEIRLLSSDPAHRPAAHFKYLSDVSDVGELVEAVKRIRELLVQRAFDDLRGRELRPGPEVTSDRDIEAYVRVNASTDYHPSCSCRMGVDEMAVVDAEMRVHGVDGLRVVDASVMPDIVSGNLNAPTQMMALRAADFILGRDALPEFHASFHFQA
ncbi:MAG: choline dehydrogenase [Gammaproteobacteria bacterium]|nr:choline dehydrogenase [Gammaproteobacteria bacterium]